MKIIVSHPTGNTNVRAVINAFKIMGLLQEFHTTLAVNPEALWLKLLPFSISEQLRRRTFPANSNQLVTKPYRELARLILPKIGMGRFVKNEYSWASIDSVYQNLDKSVAARLRQPVKKEKITAVYGYEDGALKTFRQAKKLGLTCIYDLPIAYWETGRKLMMEEAERMPAWSATLGGGIKDSNEKLERKTEELKLADIVICPGQFVLQSLPDWSNTKKMIVTPFGSPPIQKGIQIPRAQSRLRVLFVGSMSQRKGLGDLFSAIKLLNTSNIELIVMGTLMAPMEFYRKQLFGFTYLPTRPHRQVLELMRSCDVLCLPSIVEGRALVMQEAMSQGLPIIITQNTGGDDLILESKTGFLIPIRSPEAIAEKLQLFLDNRLLASRMGIAAQEHAVTYTWNGYGSKIVSELLNHLN